MYLSFWKKRTNKAKFPNYKLCLFANLPCSIRCFVLFRKQAVLNKNENTLDINIFFQFPIHTLLISRVPHYF